MMRPDCSTLTRSVSFLNEHMAMMPLLTALQYVSPQKSKQVQKHLSNAFVGLQEIVAPCAGLKTYLPIPCLYRSHR